MAEKTGAFVPYNTGPPNDPGIDEAKWQEERDRFIAQVGTKVPYLTLQAN